MLRRRRPEAIRSDVSEAVAAIGSAYPRVMGAAGLVGIRPDLERLRVNVKAKGAPLISHQIVLLGAQKPRKLAA